MAKIYLSAAAHATDNPTKCPVKCGENIHCDAYMDIVERRLKECGVETRRGYNDLKGDVAMQKRVADANSWGADLYYVAHTNAGGGRYSMTMCYPGADNVKKANVIHKYRKCVLTHKVSARDNLYEITATKMTCLYDELFFHDNAEDCKWYHNGGMELLAEETVQALCELVGVKYVATIVNKPMLSVKEWQKAAIADGYKFPKYGADGKWGSECEGVAKKAIVKKRLVYTNKNLTKLVQKVVGVTADGLCGKNTAAAIKAWQKANGLTVDGCIGINGWKKMLFV